jgi:hypothetical protein
MQGVSIVLCLIFEVIVDLHGEIKSLTGDAAEQMDEQKAQLLDWVSHLRTSNGS